MDTSIFMRLHVSKKPNQEETLAGHAIRHNKMHQDRIWFTRTIVFRRRKFFFSLRYTGCALTNVLAKPFTKQSIFIRQFKDAGIKIFCTFPPILINLYDSLGISTIHSISAYDEDIKNYLSVRLNREWRHDKRFLGKVIGRLIEDAKGK